MSKLSFRARVLDPTKPMPVYMAEELPDLPDFSAINRAVPQMPTGMQKEEECEHHLQRAICAGLIIPTPEVTDVPLKDFYDKVYPSNYKQPRQLIHMQPFTMEQEIPDYDMDSDDERWLQAQKPRLDLTPLKFEEMMDRLEKSSGQTVVTLAEAKALLKEDDELTIAVFDYWLNKRLKTQHPLILTVRTEHRSGTAANNPYLAFRRRTEKMQTRKNRKNDEVSYEKMLKLRRDLDRAVTLLELVKRREKCKREFVHLTVEVFEKRYQARDFSGAVVAEAAASKAASTPLRPAFTPIFHNHNRSWADAVAAQVHHQASAAPGQHHHSKTTIKDEVLGRREKRQYKKRKHKSRGGGLEGFSSDEDSSMGGGATVPRGASPEPEEQEDDGPFAFRRNRLCLYHKPLPVEGNWSWHSREEHGAADRRFRFTLASLSNRKCVGFARRRVGRGGRIILDRVSTDYDDFWRGMDFSIIEPKEEEPHHDPLTERLKVETAPSSSLRTANGTSTYNKYSAVAGGAQRWGLSGGEGSDKFNSDSFSVRIKEEPPEEETVEPKVEVTETTDDNSVEFLRALRRDWLHFRPKTPPLDYEPPCHLLPPDESPFADDALPCFHVEVEPLSDTPSGVLLDHAPFLTDLFQLDRRWVDDDGCGGGGGSVLGPQGPIFEEQDDEDATAKEVTEDEEEEDRSWRTVGVSSFTLTDAGGEASITGGKCGGVTEEEEDFAGGAAVVKEGKGSCESKEGCGEPQEVGSTNGLITQIGFAADVPSLNSRVRNNKLQSYAYANAHHHNPGTLSLQSVTFNNHSANNILEFPLTAAVDVAVDSAQTGQSSAPVGGQKTPNGGVRSNKSTTLVMEVT